MLITKIQENKNNVKCVFKQNLKNDGKIKQNITQVGKIAFYRSHYNFLLSNKYLSIAKEFNDPYYQRLAYAVYNCADFVKYGQFTNQIQKVFEMHTCQDRLCPTCNYRRSLRTFAKLIRIIQSKEFADKGYKSIFLTLTLKNVSQDRLGQGIDDIFYSFNKFLKNKRIKKMSKGFFRSLEITFNKARRDYHHHLHCIFVVNSSYFTQSTQYLKQADFTDIWQSSAGLDYTPIVHVEKIRDNKGIAEVSKYAVKTDKELINNLSNSEFKTLRDELRNRRLISMGGIFRDIARKLKLNLDSDDIASDDLTDEDIKDEVLQSIISLRWSVGFGKYQLAEKEQVGQVGF